MEQEMIEFSHKSITFGKQKIFNLEMINNSPTSSVVFKIKTTKLNMYDVKPAIGSIGPSQRITIEFKILDQITQQQFNDKARPKFQIQCLPVDSSKFPKTKAEYKTLWDQTKTDPSKAASVIHCTIPIINEAEQKNFNTVNSEPFSPVKLKNSFPKSQIKMATASKGFALPSEPRKDEELSKEFERLKEKEEELLGERDKIFKNQAKATSSKGSKSGVQMVLLVIAFLISVMVGNFLKLRVFVDSDL